VNVVAQFRELVNNPKGRIHHVQDETPNHNTNKRTFTHFFKIKMIQGVPPVYVYNEDSHTKFSRVIPIRLEVVKMKHFSHLKNTMYCYEEELKPIGFVHARFVYVNDIKRMKNVKNIKTFSTEVLTHALHISFFIMQMMRAYPTESIVFTLYRHWNDVYQYSEVICGEIN